MKFIEKIMNLPLWIKLTASIVLILMLLVLGFVVNINKFEDISKSSLGHINDAYNESIMLTKSNASDSLSLQQTNILLRKISILEQNKEHHLDIIQMMSKNKYSLYTLFPLLSAITAIFILLIIQKGWNSSKPHTKVYFVLFTTLTSLVGIYPEVYQTTDGISEHTKSYLDYDNLQKTIFSYSLTAPIVDRDTFEFVEFIDRVNSLERNLASLRFDIEKMSLDEEMFNTVDVNSIAAPEGE
jgi:hypothetical protein